VLDRRRVAERFVQNLFHGNESSAAIRGIGGHHDLRSRISQSRRHGGPGEAREDRHLDSAEVSARV
jgi:hypothetical protein